ncbi:uncharacterized protein LOC128650282 [Bombina bombina]|uniref:uncharacterized protein LOC128650282 n=1 Tax=Bombina bombina TaxID=8345 RepID=UPI00235A4D5F|nr:uncharacterized protein LOC128650282 [Bombina bombina]
MTYEKMIYKARESLKARFEVLTDYAISESDMSILDQFTCPDDIKLCDIEEFEGKTEIYIGKGNRTSEDRLALAMLLKDFTSQNKDESKAVILKKKIAAVKNIVVYLPSKFLYSGVEILEMPGTDESDPLAMSFIQDALDNVDAVILLSEYAFSITAEEVKDTLKNSKFIKKWLQDSQSYKLLFLSYPEKDQNCKFGANDEEKLKKLTLQDKRKKKEEMKILSKLIAPSLLSSHMKDNIVSSYVLPVLHTSIHAQEGMTEEIISRNNIFLKHTGINELFLKIDEFVVHKHQSLTEELEKNLSDLQTRQDSEVGITQETSDGIASQNIDFTHESNFLKQNEVILKELKKEHKDLITATVNGPLKELLSRTAQNAIRRWKEVESKVTDVCLFNPQYNGKHPAYKEKMYNLLFDDIDGKISPIFDELFHRLTTIFEQYKEKAIKLFKKELYGKRGARVANFERSLEYALDWHLGTRRSSLKSTLKKSFEKSCKDSLTKHILEPAYKTSIEKAKHEMTGQIQKVLSDVESSFLDNTISLYDERWPANLSKFMVRACIPLKSFRLLQPGCTFCGEIKCSVCTYMKSTSSFKSSITNKVYEIKDSLSCLSKNAIYLITCEKCGKQYVGETTQSVRRRFVDHLSTINCKKDLAVPQHFCQDDHSTSDVSLAIIEQVKNKEDILIRESYWIQELKTQKPYGLNSKV